MMIQVVIPSGELAKAFEEWITDVGSLTSLPPGEGASVNEDQAVGIATGVDYAVGNLCTQLVRQGAGSLAGVIRLTYEREKAKRGSPTDPMPVAGA